MPYMLAYALLFTAIGAGFIFIHLMIGKVVRPKRPDAEKLTVYECGEPTIGSAWVQFDLRFYVVALLFVVFDVEMAFFFPWAVVFGKTNQLAGDRITVEQREQTAKLLDPALQEQLAKIDRRIAERDTKKAELQKQVDDLGRKISDLALDDPKRPLLAEERESAKQDILTLDSLPRRRAEIVTKTKDPSASFTWVAFLDILVFFAVLLVGFAYLWTRGDLNWVRSIAAQQIGVRGEEPGVSKDDEPIKAELVSAAATSTH